MELVAQRSVLNREWQLRAEGERTEPSEAPHIPAIVKEIVARRGFGDPYAWVRPTLKAQMPDPLTVPGMGKAIEVIADAIRKRLKVAILGDYDVDGATSTAILIRWFRGCGCPEPLFHIPQRLTEGYGPNVPAIESLKARGAELLLIVDSGTTALEQVARAREIGLEVVVMDHHEPREDGVLPDCTVVNPKLGDKKMSYLCTAGLVFLGLVGISRELKASGWVQANGVDPDALLMPLMGLAALGTVADMVPLVGLNRAYVVHGLHRMGQNPGIEALARVTEVKEPASVGAAGFTYGPCINAGGRISDTMQGTRLLTLQDSQAVQDQAVRLHELNLERRAIEARIKGECLAQGEAMMTPDTKILVLHDQEWHPGVVGLAANKVKDQFGVSAVVIGTDGKGSGRSAPGFNIGLGFMRAVEAGILKKGGGHAVAGGLTIDPSRIAEFRAFMEAEAADSVRPPTKVDLVADVGDLTLQDGLDLEMIGPFGIGNSRPEVVLRGGVLENVKVLKEKHLKGILRRGNKSIEVMFFSGVGTPLGRAMEMADGHAVDILCQLKTSEWPKGNIKLQAHVEDLMVGAPVSEVAVAA